MCTRKLFLLTIPLMALAFVPPKKKIKVWLIGDSTMANKETKAYPETGWGMPFVYFFDSTVVVDNSAKNGRSAKSFIDEGLWKPVVENVQEGDDVLIQFGHNDEVKEKVGRYTTPDEFKQNLLRYVNETREKKATPILISPVTSRNFDSTGKIKETHPIYADLVKQVVQQVSVPLIDIDEDS